MRLDDETAFVTGAGRGLGAAIAARFAEEGAFVVCTDVDAESADETAADIRGDGGEAEALELDVADARAFDRTVEAVVEESGLDVLVNNAGVGHDPAPVESVDAEAFERVLDVNLRGVWNGCRAALPYLKSRESGNIVNVASVAAYRGLPTQAAYSLTKGAVLNFTRAVAAEAGPAGVRANAVCPGFVDTELGRGFFETQADPEAARGRVVGRTPLGSLASREDVANAALFLASEEASHVTGHGLVVDGGFSAQ